MERGAIYKLFLFFFIFFFHDFCYRFYLCGLGFSWFYFCLSSFFSFCSLSCFFFLLQYLFLLALYLGKECVKDFFLFSRGFGYLVEYFIVILSFIYFFFYFFRKFVFYKNSKADTASDNSFNSCSKIFA